ncbi:MAG: guanylate kinase [Planctomycetota bacterium]
MAGENEWPGKIVVVSGPSGVGKTAIVDRLLARGTCKRAITATTRAPRAGEQDGVDYFFHTRAAFEAGIQEGEFLEHAEVHGNLYGTPWTPLEKQLRAGHRVLLNIDVQGAERLMELGTNATFVFLLPPSLEELERRLRSRESDDEAAIQRRLDNAQGELARQDRYDHRVVNDDLDRAVEEIAEIVSRLQE